MMGATTRYDPCVFCGTTDVALDCAISLRGKIDADVTRCSACGLLFVNPPLGPAQIAQLYDSSYWDPPGRGAREAHRRYHRLYRFGTAYGQQLARLAPTGRLLEIGCGLGFFLKGAADHCGWKIEGIDPAEGMSEFAREKLGLRVTGARFEENEFPDQTFDFVRAKDVLEHVPAPIAFLSEVHRILRPGGRFELWLPNGPLDLAPARRAHRGGERQEMGAGHLLFISPRALRGMLEAGGFRVEQSSVFMFRNALRAKGLYPSRTLRAPAAAPPPRPAQPEVTLHDWEPPPRQRGLRGTQLYTRLRGWRSCHPALPSWLPLGFCFRVLARKV